MNYEEKMLSRKPVYKGGIIDVEVQEVLLPNGKKATRDVVLHPGASAVLPITGDGEVYVVRQFRKPIDKVSIELPAGKLDHGEDPVECAGRELREETGLRAQKLQHLASIHSTPGFSNEVLHLYVATGLDEGEACTDEDEFVSAEKYTVDRLLEMVLKHEITDAKTIIGILFADKIVKGEIKL